MRLWHQILIPSLPRLQLQGQHRECCAMRGQGWGQRHSVVNYIWKYPRIKLVRYHLLIIQEMKNRGIKPNSIWECPNYCGKQIGFISDADLYYLFSPETNGTIIYPEHDFYYLKECINNLNGKGFHFKIILKEEKMKNYDKRRAILKKAGWVRRDRTKQGEHIELWEPPWRGEYGMRGLPVSFEIAWTQELKRGMPK